MPGPGGGCLVGGCLVPGGLLWGGAWSWEVVTGPGGSVQWGEVPDPRGGVVSQHALRQTPPGEMTSAADGTYPTGMHSCFHLLISDFNTLNFFVKI